MYIYVVHDAMTKEDNYDAVPENMQFEMQVKIFPNDAAVRVKNSVAIYPWHHSL